MNVYDTLFQLQLRLKQSKVNEERKREEVKRLCESYEIQFRHLIYLLYHLSIQLWHHIKNNPNFEQDPNSKNINFVDFYKNLSGIPSEPPEQTIKADSKVINEISQLQNQLGTLIQNDNDTLFSFDNFLLILTSFDFFWSKEMTESFTNFILTLNNPNNQKLIQCLVVHPLVHLYFRSSLQHIFSMIGQLPTENLSVKEIRNSLFKSLETFSPLIPPFIKTIFQRLNSSVSEKLTLFYQLFLRIFLVNFGVFDISSNEFSVFHGQQLNAFIQELDAFFENPTSDETFSVDNFFNTLFVSTESICTAPIEERLISISKRYQPASLFDKRLLPFIKNPLPKFPGNLVFIPHTHDVPPATNIPTPFPTDNIDSIASRILLKTDLIRIDETQVSLHDSSSRSSRNSLTAIPPPQPLPDGAVDAPKQPTSMHPFDYFEKLVDLSFSRVADPEVEVDLDKLQQQVEMYNLSLENICEAVEKQLTKIETTFVDNSDGDYFNSNVDEDGDIDHQLASCSRTNNLDPLQRISWYSRQYSNINKLCEFVKSEIQSSLNAAAFNCVLSYLNKNLTSKNVNWQQLRSSAEFVKFYSLLFDRFMNKDEDQIAPSTTEPCPINSDFITHRYFHSVLSFKLDLLAQLKNEESVVAEGAALTEFLKKHRDELIDTKSHDFLAEFIENPSKLAFFNREFLMAFTSDMPFDRIEHIHQAYQSLIGLLQMQGMDEIGADQLIPFAMVATVILMTDPKINEKEELTSALTFTYAFLSRYIEPFLTIFNMLDHPQEYSFIQFLSTYQYLIKTMKENSQ